ncbi:MAG: DUF1800 domain-containing protein [Pseudomonadota bacterium]
MTIKTVPTRDTFEAIRFGFGRPGPTGTPVTQTMPGRKEVAAASQEFRRVRKSMKDSDGKPSDAERSIRDRLRRTISTHWTISVARAVSPEDDFFERAAHFWFDHFTIELTNIATMPFVQPYIEEAIRPNVYGYFADLLKAAAMHPSMLLYLDQAASIGPNSVAGNRREGRGLNENLAREILELHTLGVDAAYTQTDVRELAELLTGLSLDAGQMGFNFRPAMAEPGPETILGKRYGGARRADLSEIAPIFEDLAMHPDTARHISRKLAVHFVSDTPSEALVADLTAVYMKTDGYLPALYEALRAHPEALDRFGSKAKQPFDFLVSAFRALGVEGSDIIDAPPGSLKRFVIDPLDAMGQPWRAPGGPDGWPEELEAWITPQGMATRISWALEAPKAMGLKNLEPEVVMDRALGELASDRLRWAVPKAESRRQGVALVLASPEFNRR